MPAKRQSSASSKDSSSATIGFEAKLFYSTQIPIRLWFIGKNETAGKCRALSELELALAA